MKLLYCVVVVSLSIACAIATPSISETFESSVRITVSHHIRGNDTGIGLWAVDVAGQKRVESYQFDGGKFDSFELDRYDTGNLYRIFGFNKSRCDQFDVKGEKLPSTWAWLDDSKYYGKSTWHDYPVDIWINDVSYATRRIAIVASGNSIPVWMETKSTERDVFIEFNTWSTNTPAEKDFAVPAVCTHPSGRPPVSSDACIAQSTIMSRAEVWVKAKVPYNTNGRYEEYREDCSGYVSYCWAASKPGLDTEEFHEMAHPITKAELLPGDCMLNAGDHVCLFGGWTDSSKTHYNAYEETQPCSTNPNYCGTRIDNTVYPYYLDPSKFLPYRYNNRCA